MQIRTEAPLEFRLTASRFPWHRSARPVTLTITPSPSIRDSRRTWSHSPFPNATNATDISLSAPTPAAHKFYRPRKL